MISVALGVLAAVGVLVCLFVLVNVVAAAYVLLWHGIDDYGPLKHWWLEKRRRR